MPAPTLKLIRITSPGTTYNNNLKRLNESAITTPYGNWVGTGAATGYEKLAHGNVEAGQWSVPAVLALQFDGGTVSQIRTRLYDPVSNLEDFTAGTPWDFRVKLLKDYVDPTGISSATIAAWPTLPMGAGATPYDIDANKPNPGNDGTSGLLTAHNSVGNRYISNFYVYLAFKPEANAEAGLHTDWGLRFNWVYPAT